MSVPPFLYRLYEKFLHRQLQSTNRPRHVGLIVDGNRRFALANGLATRKAGHMAGSDRLEDFLKWCLELNIEIVTLYGFSTENYKRSSEEVEELMTIILNKFRTLQADPLIASENVKIKVIGRRDGFSQEMQDEIVKVEAMTESHNNFQLNVAIGYGGRAEIVDAVKRIGKKIKSGAINVDDIDEDMLSNNLYTEGLPDPDLIIRTSGEERLSGFLLWQSAYSELYFTEVFWPAFRKIDFWRAIRVWQQRNRRFGK
ncbi:MAG: polyprenyl diphosphate synthase [Porticoccaceae bacterium]|nr:polyprenyl diphosphate synthase [Porticoccaceae bacterium]MDG1475000.1 polyprenyl diphosphate synthase [Porticoccaceae bacterium]